MRCNAHRAESDRMHRERGDDDVNVGRPSKKIVSYSISMSLSAIGGYFARWRCGCTTTGCVEGRGWGDSRRDKITNLWAIKQLSISNMFQLIEMMVLRFMGVEIHEVHQFLLWILKSIQNWRQRLTISRVHQTATRYRISFRNCIENGQQLIWKYKRRNIRAWIF